MAVARRAIPCGAVEITRRMVTRFGLPVTEPGRDVAVLCSQPSLPAAHPCQLIGPGVFAVLGGVCAIFGRNPAVVDGLGAVVGGPRAPRGRFSTFVCRVLTVARRAIARGSVEITRCVVTRFGFLVTQPGRDVAVLCSQPSLPAAHPCQLVGPRIFEVLGGLGPIFGRNPAVVDGLGAVVRSARASRGGLRTFICRVLSIARRAIARGSVEITRRVVTRFGFPVAQLGRDVTVLRSQPGLPAAHSRQLVGPRIFEVLGGLGSIFGRNPAVVDGLGAVVRSLSVPRGSLATFAGSVLTVARRAIASGSVEVTSRVVTRFGLSVTLLGFSVTHVRSQIAVATFCVALPGDCGGVVAFIRATAVLIGAYRRGPSFSHVSRFQARRGGFGLKRRPTAITIAATAPALRMLAESRANAYGTP